MTNNVETFFFQNVKPVEANSSIDFLILVVLIHKEDYPSSQVYLLSRILKLCVVLDFL